jgi:sugar lactone lactonase YvrE
MGPDGSLYVADTGNGKIRKIANGTVSTVAGVGGAPEHSDSNPNIFNLVDGPCAGAYFSGPSGIAVDQSGTIYVAEKGSNVIRKITNPDTDACTVSTLAGEPYNYQAGWEYADGTGSNARFYSPRNLILDAAGNLYVTDYGNYAIRKVTPEGVVTTLASNHDLFNTNYQFNHPDTTPVTAGGVDSPLINRPNGIIMDGNGNLYVGNDSEFNSIIDIGANILQVTPDGTASVFFTHYSGNGGLTIGADGALYVTHGYAIEQITMNGAQDTTFAGDFYNGGWRDGAADQSLFSSPVGLFADASGAIYVADTGNNMIRKIAPAQ